MPRVREQMAESAQMTELRLGRAEVTMDKADIIKLLEAGMTRDELFKTLADIETAAAQGGGLARVGY
jgi:hypothetical protein